jgi:hypothetical protein
MEKYEYSKEWYKCTYDLYLDSCRNCLFQTLCNLEKQRWNTTTGQEEIS